MVPEGQGHMSQLPDVRHTGTGWWTISRRWRLWSTGTATFAAGLLLFHMTEPPAFERALTFRLVELPPAATGIHFVHQKPTYSSFFHNVEPFLAAVSASACVTDVDRDGLLDLFMVNSGQGSRNRLYMNKGGFRFVEGDGSETADLNRNGYSSDCTFADLNNDGFDDLLIGTMGQRPRMFFNVSDGAGARRFTDVTEESGLPDYINGFASVFLDVDRDGDLDLIMAGYLAPRYRPEDAAGAPYVHPMKVPHADGAGRILPNSWARASNGGRKHLLLNDGTGRFHEQALDAWGLSETRFTFDIGTADVNLDGFTDVYFANDFGPDQLYLNQAGQRFVDIKGGRFSTELGRDSFKGMNTDFGDIDHDGYPEIYVTNIFHPLLPEGNILWSNRPHRSGDRFLRSFQNVANLLGARDGGWGWGAKFVDIDLDGETDIVATNGFISANPNEDYWYRMTRLTTGLGRTIEDSRNWPAFGEASMSGYERSHIFVRHGERYYDRAADAGITRSFDGRGVVIADFDVDGRPDVLFVAQGGPYFLGRNDFVPQSDQAAPAFVGIRLHGDGVRVNTMAVGSRVRIAPSDPDLPYAFEPVYREVSAGNGMSAQSMAWIGAGLGSYQGPVDVTVYWTNGEVETIPRLLSGRYHDVRMATERPTRTVTGGDAHDRE
jgi:enediyne biosynthesis protein E4